MEELLHYVWKHKILPLRELRTTDGRVVEVINPGIHNTNAGPDFTGAKVKLDGIEWVGNVELHQKTSDWFRHHHDTDAAYENIVLHVAGEVDQQLFYPNGQEVPQLQLEVPSYVKENYETLKQNDCRPYCRDVVNELPASLKNNWLNVLSMNRMEDRARQIMQRCEQLNKNWEDTLFVTLARNFGFGLNGDAFERWAQSIPMSVLAKHRDNLFQIEAIFFGQAGLLNEDRAGEYYPKLQKEYKMLRQKFSLTPINEDVWRFSRLRPQNFPYIRIAQLAMLYHEQRLNLSRLLNAQSLNVVNSLLLTHVSNYWRIHYTFGSKPDKPSDRNLSRASIQLIVINTVAPMLFAYGKYRSDQTLCDRALSMWQQLKAEDNAIIRDWAAAGVQCENAADSQALIQLQNRYCQRRDCLRCKFGYEYLKRTPGFLREQEGDAS